MKRTLIQWISIALEASKVSHPKDRQHIAERWSDLLDDIENNLLLSGSGFDAGTALDREKSTNNKIVFTTSFHHMNEHGFYVRWTEHKVTLSPEFVGGPSIEVSGRNYRDIKEHIAHAFLCCLDTPEYNLHKAADGSTGFYWKLEEVVEEMETSSDTNK